MALTRGNNPYPARAYSDAGSIARSEVWTDAPSYGRPFLDRAGPSEGPRSRVVATPYYTGYDAATAAYLDNDCCVPCQPACVPCEPCAPRCRTYYIVPCDTGLRRVESAEPVGYIEGAPPEGGVRPWLGVTLKWLDDLDLGGRNNVAVVHQVQQGSPAAKAGLQAEDQLEFWNHIKIDSATKWKSLVRGLRVGDTVTFGIHRNRQDRRVAVRIEGTTRHLGGKHRVSSSNAVHTDNAF